MRAASSRGSPCSCWRRTAWTTAPSTPSCRLTRTSSSSLSGSSPSSLERYTSALPCVRAANVRSGCVPRNATSSSVQAFCIRVDPSQVMVRGITVRARRLAAACTGAGLCKPLQARGSPLSVGSAASRGKSLGCPPTAPRDRPPGRSTPPAWCPRVERRLRARPPGCTAKQRRPATDACGTQMAGARRCCSAGRPRNGQGEPMRRVVTACALSSLSIACCSVSALVGSAGLRRTAWPISSASVDVTAADRRQQWLQPG